MKIELDDPKNYLAEDGFNVDGKISMWTPKAANNTEAQPL